MYSSRKGLLAKQRLEVGKVGKATANPVPPTSRELAATAPPQDIFDFHRRPRVRGGNRAVTQKN